MLGSAPAPGPHPAVTQGLAVQQPDQPRLPAVGNLNHRLRPPQVDLPDAATLQAADVGEQGQDVGLGGPARQGFEVDQCHARDYTGSLARPVRLLPRCSLPDPARPAVVKQEI